jgi:hypothetical protein
VPPIHSENPRFPPGVVVGSTSGSADVTTPTGSEVDGAAASASAQVIELSWWYLIDSFAHV